MKNDCTLYGLSNINELKGQTFVRKSPLFEKSENEKDTLRKRKTQVEKQIQKLKLELENINKQLKK